MRAIIELLQLIAILIYEKIFGNSRMKCVNTGKSIMLSFTVNGNNYDFKSTQYKQTIGYGGIFWFRRTNYYYKVELVNNKNSYTAHYAHMCPKFLHATTYPHRIAIREHFNYTVKNKLI